MTYEKTKFTNLFREFGGTKKVISSIDFISSLVLSCILCITILIFNIERGVFIAFYPMFVEISATMIGITIAAVAIVVSMSNPEFIKILKKAKVYENILFMFWYSAIISGISVITNIISSILTMKVNSWLAITLFTIGTFFMLYSMFTVLLLVGTTMRYGIYRAEFMEK